MSNEQMLGIWGFSALPSGAEEATRRVADPSSNILEQPQGWPVLWSRVSATGREPSADNAESVELAMWSLMSQDARKAWMEENPF
ncbi:MAG: hypothetical protein HZC42_04960 [Candidatus Eisenbacteria bacterium]|nr:hypothetical protein [Candidatus Eisenbacteria bacterium]